MPNAVISNPKIDGREIALTHQSVEILKKLNVWQNFSKKIMSTIKEARILDGDSSYYLNFNPVIKDQVLKSGAPPHAHNLFVQTASDSGIIGIGLMLAFLTILYIRAYKLFKFSGWEIRSAVFFVILSISCFLVDHMIEWNWPGPMFIYHFTFFIFMIDFIK